MGAWIETDIAKKLNRMGLSHPVWVRGLKLHSIVFSSRCFSRTLYGCVD